MSFDQENQSESGESNAEPRTGVTRPSLGLSELVLQLWRAKWLMLLVFLPIFLVGLFVASQMPKKYTAYSRVQVSLGREYVYEPLVGDAGKGAALESEAVVRAEIEKTYSPVIPRRVLAKIGLGKIYPELAEKAAQATTDEERIKARAAALKGLQANFVAGAAPGSPVIRINFTHKDPDVAAEVTDAFVDEYLAYRINLLSDDVFNSVSRQRSEFEGQLSKAEKEIRAFLITNRISDFEAERIALGDRHAAISNELFQVEASKREAEARLSVLQQQLANMPEEVELYVDTTGDEQLLNLQIEREQLLGRYRADSQPVREIETWISNLRQLLQSSEGGVRRRGQNPAHVDLNSRVAIQSAELDAMRSRALELTSQLGKVEKRQVMLIDLLPEYQKLVRDQAVLESSVKNLAEREQTRRAERELNAASTSVTVLERAFPPTEGKSMKMIAALASLVFAGFTALMVGLGYTLTRKGLATRASAERTLGLPVIGQVPKHKLQRA